MRISLFTLLLTLSFAIGCHPDGGEGRPRTNPPDDVGESRVEILKNLNRSVSESFEAVTEVFPDRVTGRASEKVSKMAELIRKGKCLPEGRRAFEKLDHDWSAEFEVSSETCPIRWLENWNYNHGTRTWERSLLYIARSDAYRELNGVERIDGFGKLWVEEKDGVVEIEGRFRHKDFQIAGLGNLTLEISTSQSYPGLNRGGGRVDLLLRLPNQWQTTASIEWKFPDPAPIYRMNGSKVDEKLFLDLFSGFGLTEIMELSLQMR